MYKMIGYVIRGKTRADVLRALDKPMTPTQLANKLKNHRSTISRTLLSMEKQKLVKCLNFKDKTGRLYDITVKGKDILKKIK